MDKGIKLAIILIIVCCIIGIVFGGLFRGYTQKVIIIYGLMGAFLGAIGAPEIEPKYFKYPTTWQMFFSIAGCLVFAFGLNSPPEGYFIAMLVGALLGYTAHYWVKHVVFP